MNEIPAHKVSHPSRSEEWSLTRTETLSKNYNMQIVIWDLDNHGRTNRARGNFSKTHINHKYEEFCFFFFTHRCSSKKNLWFRYYRELCLNLPSCHILLVDNDRYHHRNWRWLQKMIHRNWALWILEKAGTILPSENLQTSLKWAKDERPSIQRRILLIFE